MAKLKSPGDWQAFSKLSPAKRSATLVAVVASVVMVVAYMMTPKSTAHLPSVKSNETNLAIPQNKDITNEKLASRQTAEGQKLEEQAQAIASLRQENVALRELITKPMAPDPNLDSRLNAIADQVAALAGQQKEKDVLSKTLPPPVAGPAVQPLGEPPPELGNAMPGTDKPKIRIIGDDTPSKHKDVSAQKPPAPYLPAASFFEVVTLNGMDAPTNPVAVKNPVPALARIKTDAILPNHFLHDVKDCFILMAGYGSMSSERAIIRLESISCTGPDGKIMESKIDGYVVGEDGRVGMRGRLVSKQGQIVAKALAAGVLSGFGTAITPLATPGLNINSGTSYAQPSPGSIATSAVGKGFSDAASSASKFYLDVANEMTPIIEIDAGRKVTVVLTKGIELK